MRRLMLIISALTLLACGTAAAQRAELARPLLSSASASLLYTAWPAGPLDPQGLVGERLDTVPRQLRPTYWKEGGIVGAAVAGIPSALFAGALCAYLEYPRTGCVGETLLGGVIGGGVGFLLGALVGGQFNKTPRPLPTDSPAATRRMPP